MSSKQNNFNCFIGAFIKSILATCCAYFIANKQYVLATITSSGIGLVWTLNVSNIIIANWGGRFYYILGFTLGVGVSCFLLRSIFGI